MAEPGRVRRLLNVLRAEGPDAAPRSSGSAPAAGRPERGPVPVAGRAGPGAPADRPGAADQMLVLLPVARGASGPSSDDRPWYEQRGAEVLAGLGFPWSAYLPGWTIEFLPGREGLLGGTWTYERRIEIYVRPDQPFEDVAFTVAHELGHAVDVTRLEDADRMEWKRQRGLDAWVPWWVESGATDLWSGSGDWAEAFAVWLVGGESHSRIAGQPTAADLAAVVRIGRTGATLAA